MSQPTSSTRHVAVGVFFLAALGVLGRTADSQNKAVRPAQKVTIRPIVFSWSDLREIQKSLPTAPVTGIPFLSLRPSVTLEIPPIEIALKGDHAQPSAPTAGVEKLLPCAGFASEPAIGAGFDAQLDVPDANGFSFIPPDVAGAVGPSHLMTMLANKVMIQDRLGGVTTSVDTSTFWGPLGTTPLSPTTTYQRVMFDALEGRWIATAREGTLGALNTRILFAFSQTDDPTGVWDFYSITADPAGVPTSGADWVVTGYNTDWITICANMFNSTGASFLGTKMWTIDVNTALVPGGPITVYTFATGWTTAVHGSGGNSVMPAQTLDSDPTLWMINTAFTSSNIQLFQISRITTSGGAPVLSAIAGSPFGGTTSFCFTTTSWSSTQRTMAQVGDARFIAPFSVRQASVVTRNGKIWAANSGGLPGPANNAAPTSNGVIWRQIDPTLPFPGSPGAPGTMVVQDGAITNGTNTMSMFPALAVNCADDVLIGYSNGDASISPRACYSMRLGTSPLNFMGAINELKAGESVYWKNFGVGTTATWGRYNSAAVDPNDNRTLWTLQEYADQRVATPGVDNDSRWGTWWGRLGECEVRPVITDDPDDVLACVGDPVSFTVVATTGSNPLTYQWRFNGVDILGATADTYSIGSSVPGDGGIYDVVVTGCGQKTSLPATLSFAGAAIGTQPVSVSAFVGAPASFFVAATGSGTLTYQWLFNGNPILGANADTLSIPAVAPADYGTYSCIVSDDCGPVTSDTAQLNFGIKGGKDQPGELSLHIFEGPQSTVGCLGGTVTLSVTAYPSTVSYLWRHNGTPIAPPQTASSLVIYPVTAVDAGNYDVQVTLGPNTITSSPAALVLTVCDASPVEPGPLSCPSTVPQAATCGSCASETKDGAVYLFSGEVYSTLIDVRIPGRGFDFVLARKYRSRIGADGAQGPGWDMSYDIRLERAGPHLLLRDGNSRADTYRLQPDGTWRLAEFFRAITRRVDGSHDLTFADTGRWHFLPQTHPTAPGKIDSIVDRNGNTMRFAYDGAGRLATVYDTLHTVTNPRPVTLSYTASGQLATVTDWTGRQWTYAYYQNGDAGGSAGDLKSLTTPAVVGTPNGNDFPSGKTTTYTYSKGFADERLNHNLLTITDPKGQTFLTNVYSTTTNPDDLAFDRVVRQVLGDPGDIIDYVYLRQIPSVANSHATQKTIVNDRVGNVAEYFFDTLNREVIARKFTGRAPNADAPTTDTQNRPTNRLRATDPVFFETRHEYNADSLVTRTVYPNLNEELFAYDEANPDPRAHGNLLQHCSLPGPLGGDQAQICESFEYDTGFGGCCGTNFVTRQVDGRGHETLNQYDMAGNRIHTTHRIPSVVEDWEYNASGQMTAHVLPDNGSAHRRRDEYTYYSSGPQAGFLQSQTVDAPGLALKTMYEYDSLGRRVRIIDPRGHDTLYIYDQLGQIVRERSREVTPGGVRYEQDSFYDANDNLVRIDVQNIDDQQQLVVSNPYLSTLHDFDVLNKITRTCREKGSYTVLASQLTCAGLPANQFLTTEYAYDANRNPNLIRMGEATNGNQPANVVATLYDERDLAFRRTRGAGDATPSTDECDYDGNANLVSTLEGLEDQPHITTIIYDGFDRRVSRTDGMGNVETDHYDASGNRISRRIDGQLVDVAGSIGNQRLSEVVYAYDNMNRLIATDTAFFDTATGTAIGDGHSMQTVVYSGASQAVQATNDNGHGRQTIYDTVDRVAATIDAKGNTVTYAYDENSNVVSTTSTEKSDLGSPDQVFVTTVGYDNLDRQTSVVDNVGNTALSRYDSRRNLTRSIDALGEHTKYVYDGVDRLLQTIRDMNGNGPDANDAADIVTAQTWDDSSRLIGQTDDNGNTTATLFDARNRCIGEQYADGTSHSFILDVHGSTTQMIDANGSVVSATYDALDRVLQKAIVAGPGVSDDTTFEAFQYDGLSRLVRAEDDDSLVMRGYDSLANVTRETQNSLTITSSYDGEGNELDAVYPGGRTVNCTYDALERKDVISDQGGMIAAYSYQGGDRVERRDYGNGARTAYLYDGILPNPSNDFGVKRIVRTTHSVVASGAILDDRTDAWDPLANKTQRADVRSGSPMLVHDYTYDPADRLIQSVATSPGGASGVIAYTLDGVGNRTAVTGGSHPGAYTMHAGLPEPADRQVNQYTTTPFGARSYDRQGNVVEALGPPSNSYSYDYHNQLVACRKGIVRYLYDALGRRTCKVFSMARGASQHLPLAVRYFYKGWQVIEERDRSGGISATYVYGNYIDEPLTMTREGAVCYYHADDEYNVVALSDIDGEVSERCEYEDFGAPLFRDRTGAPRARSAAHNPLLFAGREYDSETGLYCSRTRYLDSEIGRFISRDHIGPWGDKENLGNGVTYVGNNPQTYLDPSGRIVITDVAMIYNGPNGAGFCGYDLLGNAYCNITCYRNGVAKSKSCSGFGPTPGTTETDGFPSCARAACLAGMARGPIDGGQDLPPLGVPYPLSSLGGHICGGGDPVNASAYVSSFPALAGRETLKDWAAGIAIKMLTAKREQTENQTPRRRY